MNIFIHLIWFVLVIMIILFFREQFEVIKGYRDTKYYQTKDIIPRCKIPSLENLQSVSQTSKCCQVEGTQTGTRVYQDQTTGFVFLVEETSLPRYYLNVCQEFCSEGISSNGQCIKQSNQDNFERCVNLLKPVNCTAASVPIAKKGLQVLYAKHICNSINDCSVCERLVDCS